MEFFESYCKYDDTVLKEFTSANFHSKLSSKPFIVAYVLLALPTVYSLVVGEYRLAALSCLIWLGAIVGILLWINPKRMASQLRNKLDLGYGGEIPEIRNIFTDKNIRQHNMLTGDDKEINYSIVKQINETEHLFVILLLSGTSCICDKRSFTKGKPEDFLIFMNNKLNG